MVEKQRRDEKKMSEHAVGKELNRGSLLLKLLPQALDGAGVEAAANEVFNRLLAFRQGQLAQLAQLLSQPLREGRGTGFEQKLAIDEHFFSARFEGVNFVVAKEFSGLRWAPAGVDAGRNES